MASAARVARAAPNQIAPSAGSGTGSGGPGPGPGPGPAAIPAAVPQAVPALPAAEAIGSEFVGQYYAAMHARLDQLHRFYAEDSSLSVAGPAPPPVAATGLRAIDDALRRLAARRARVTVTSVDALHSAHGAVVVVVTGRAIPGAAENEPTEAIATGRGFTQTFVLAPQRNGFYVKNDLVRFLPPEAPRSDVRSIGATPTLPVKSDTVPNAGAAPNAEPAKRAPPPPVGESQSLEAVEAKLAATARRAADPRAPRETPSRSVATDPERPIEQNTPMDSIGKPPAVGGAKLEKLKEAPPAGPPSYAATLLKARAAAAEASAATETRVDRHAASSPSAEKPPSVVPVAVGKPTTAASFAATKDATISSESLHSSSENRAVFVRHFPPAATEADLRAAFGAFGAVAEDGVTLRASKTQKSELTVEKHAFVEFVDRSGFLNALRTAETSDVLVLGAAVGVEAKREKPPGRRSERDRRGAEAGADAAARRAPRRGTSNARPRGEGDAGRREGGAGRNRGRADRR